MERKRERKLHVIRLTNHRRFFKQFQFSSRAFAYIHFNGSSISSEMMVFYQLAGNKVEHTHPHSSRLCTFDSKNLSIKKCETTRLPAASKMKRNCQQLWSFEKGSTGVEKNETDGGNRKALTHQPVNVEWKNSVTSVTLRLMQHTERVYVNESVSFRAELCDAFNQTI